MQLGEARKPNSYLQLPRIGDNQLKILWGGGYDGPEGGVLLYQGRKCLFTICDLLEDDTKILLVVELSEEQLRIEEYWHDLFVRKVGPHCTYYPVQSWPDKVTPETIKEYYDLWARRTDKPDYSSYEAIGWFTFPGTEGLFELRRNGVAGT